MSLQVQQLVKHFEGVKAVKGVSFEVNPGECVALIGPNGAGKSTCFACIAGQHGLTSGAVFWAGQRLDQLPVQVRLQRGVARTFQVAQTFEALTVGRNVQLALQVAMSGGRSLSAWRHLETKNAPAAMALLAQVGLADLADGEVLGLAYGAKKRLELAIALAGITSQGNTAAEKSRAPKLLLLDEPAAGLAAPERADLMRVVKSLAQSGVAVLYTEHNMDAVFGVADRVLVLIDGEIAAQGRPDEIANDAAVRSRYLGHHFGQPLEQAVGEPNAAKVESGAHA